MNSTLSDAVTQTIYITDQCYLPRVQQGRGDAWREGKGPTSKVVVSNALARLESPPEAEAFAVIEE